MFLFILVMLWFSKKLYFSINLIFSNDIFLVCLSFAASCSLYIRSLLKIAFNFNSSCCIFYLYSWIRLWLSSMKNLRHILGTVVWKYYRAPFVRIGGFILTDLGNTLFFLHRRLNCSCCLTRAIFSWNSQKSLDV